MNEEEIEDKGTSNNPEDGEPTKSPDTENDTDGSTTNDAGDKDPAKGKGKPIGERTQEEWDQLHGRATRAEAELKRKKQEQGNKGGKSPSQKAKPLNEEQLDDLLELRDRGFNRDEIKRIREHAELKGTPLIEASEDPFVRGGINALREKKKAEAATPAPSNATTRQRGNKTFKDKTKEERAKDHGFDAWKARRKQRQQ
jgi:hypothetical protein